MNFKDKKIIITGATGGIGHSLVKKFCDSGGKILATGTKTEKLEKLKNEFSSIEIEQFKLNEHENIEKFMFYPFILFYFKIVKALQIFVLERNI